MTRLRGEHELLIVPTTPTRNGPLDDDAATLVFRTGHDGLPPLPNQLDRLVTQMPAHGGRDVGHQAVTIKLPDDLVAGRHERLQTPFRSASGLVRCRHRYPPPTCSARPATNPPDESQSLTPARRERRSGRQVG